MQRNEMTGETIKAKTFGDIEETTVENTNSRSKCEAIPSSWFS